MKEPHIAALSFGASFSLLAARTHIPISVSARSIAKCNGFVKHS
jgi:hypothetical protein